MAFDDNELFHSLSLWSDKTIFDSDDDDDDIYKPDDNSDDDDDIGNEDVVKETSETKSTYLKGIIKRLDGKDILAEKQIFLTKIPTCDELPPSLFTVPQWDLLRHQCRLHFALLCRSIRFITLCASSDNILDGVLALIHTYYKIFMSSVEMTNELNELMGSLFFIPALGDPDKSYIKFAPYIISHFLEKKPIDELIEAPFFKNIFRAFPFNNVDKPNFLLNLQWTLEETDLLQCVYNRLKTPELIQKYAMPCRNASTIRHHFKQEWILLELANQYQQREMRNEPPPPPPPQQQQDEDDDSFFVIPKGSRFDEAQLQ